MKSLLVYIFVLITKLILKTIKYEVIGLDRYKELKASGKRVVFAIWHGQLALFYPMARYSKSCGIVSRSRDGELAASVIKHFGFASVRGSSSKAGAIAIIEAEKYIKNGYDIVVTVDGPKGPRFSVKNGAIYISRRFNCPIIPVIVYINRYKMFKSWDRFTFPLPFANIKIFLGDPIIPNPDIKKDEIKKETESLRKIMLEMTEKYAKFYL
ncbi:MAG: lysophospholipid acyltransferase family protein [Calditerrivibrio sp.]|uniref:lysophospholipid acyltransferase family protein n=1 Tax=Calditerrivibrio sp. TaxID=2792612 RepID=UPI003D0E7D57